MVSNPLRLLDQYMKDDLHCHIDLIKGDNPASFTRKRIISIQDLLLQMLTRKNRTQFSEVMAYYDSMNKSMPVTEKAFFTARKKFNPEAVRVMSNEFIAKVYDDYDDSIKKWKDLVILGIDGSKCIVPNTVENSVFFGTHDNGSGTSPAMALISTLHDSINNLKLDVQTGLTGAKRIWHSDISVNTATTIIRKHCLYLTEDMFRSVSWTESQSAISIF